MNLKEAEVLALSTLKQVMEEKVRCAAFAVCPAIAVIATALYSPCVKCRCALARMRAWTRSHGLESCACQLGVAVSLLSVLCDQVTATNVDIASVGPTYHLYNQEEIQEVISRL